MANPDYGFCVCPVCKYQRAAVRIAANNKAYVNCDECSSSVRTLSGPGDRSIRSWIVELVSGPAPAPAPAPVPKADPEPEVKPNKKGGFSDALDVLTGGKRG